MNRVIAFPGSWTRTGHVDLRVGFFGVLVIYVEEKRKYRHPDTGTWMEEYRLRRAWPMEALNLPLRLDTSRE